MNPVNLKNSANLFESAKYFTPGGVHSPVRSLKAVNAQPIFMDKAQGSYIWDIDNNRYLDFVGGFGPHIAGHTHPAIIKAIIEQTPNILASGTPNPLAPILSAMICEIVPTAEQVRLVNSGTEACMSAIRLARAYTKRDLIIKFSGCYHGHSDSMLVKAGSGCTTTGYPDSAGIPLSHSATTIVAPFNDSAIISEIFAKYSSQIAGIIVEPIAGNMGLITPTPGFLTTLRNLCNKYNSVLIFDEVMTGFRVSLGGAQELYQVYPDLTCLGKIIGGGLPIGAIAGHKDIMAMLSPIGPVYQAGTLSANPLSCAAGIANLNLISEPNFHTNLTTATDKFCSTINTTSAKNNWNLTTNHVCGMLSIFLTPTIPTNYNEAQQTNTKLFVTFWQNMLKSGIYWPPSAYESAFIASTHTQDLLQNAATTITNAYATALEEHHATTSA